MNSVGITRKIDELGRIVIPKEIRTELNININHSVEFYTDDDKIIIQKYEEACMFCGNRLVVRIYNGLRICGSCISKIKNEMDEPEFFLADSSDE